MARPKKPYHQKLTKQVNFRLNETDHQSITLFCKENKVTVGDLVKAGMNKYYRPAKATVDKELIIQISKTGNNLNQIARKLNQGNFIEKQWSDIYLTTINNALQILKEIRKELL